MYAVVWRWWVNSSIFWCLKLRFRSRLKNKKEETSNLVKRDKMGFSKKWTAWLLGSDKIRRASCTHSTSWTCGLDVDSIFYIALYTFWKYFDPSWRPFLWQNSGWADWCLKRKHSYVMLLSSCNEMIWYDISYYLCYSPLTSPFLTLCFSSTFFKPRVSPEVLLPSILIILIIIFFFTVTNYYEENRKSIITPK